MREFPPHIERHIKKLVESNTNPNSISKKIEHVYGEKYNYRTIISFITRVLNYSWLSGNKKYISTNSSVKSLSIINQVPHTSDKTPIIVNDKILNPAIDDHENFIENISSQIKATTSNDENLANYLETFTKELRKYHAEIKAIKKKITKFEIILDELQSNYTNLANNNPPFHFSHCEDES